jgi:NAD(P)-dependent dehydrogenase (short-subunit alcohol dehydrogenase family)
MPRNLNVFGASKQMSRNTTVAFITGGNRGIGLDTARQLGKQGVTIVIGARDPKAAEAAVAELRKEGISAESTRYDAAKPETDASAFAYLQEHFGKLDILVNNAGILKEPFPGSKNASTISSELLHETFETNFFAVVRLTQALLPLLRKSDAGRIVNLSSVLGSLTVHSLKDSPIAQAKAFAYNASKTALNAFTVHLADELRDTAIKVNSVHPGWVKTPLGGSFAPSEVEGSGKTSARLALIGKDGPSGGFFDGDVTLDW